MNGHSTQDNYEHFLAYSGLFDNPILRYAYFHGADEGIDLPNLQTLNVARTPLPIDKFEALQDASEDLGPWMSAALDDPKACKEFKVAADAFLKALHELLEARK